MGRIKDWLLETGGPSPKNAGSNNGNRGYSSHGRQGMAVINGEGEITYIDATFATIFGYTGAGELLESDLETLYPQRELGRINVEIIPQLEEQEVWEGRVTGFKKGEKKFNHHLSISKTSGDDFVWKVKESPVSQAGLPGLGGVEEQLSTLRQGLSALQELTTEGEILRETLDILDGIINFDFCAVQLDEENIHVAKSNMGGDGFFRIGEGLGQLSSERGKVVRGDHLGEYPEFEPKSDYFNSFISVPVGDMGSVQVVSRAQDNFTQGDADLLQILTNHLSEKLSRVQLESALKTKAIHDQLTGLYNRHYLTEILAKEVERADRYNHKIAFLMIDVNRFKDVNDSYSHAIGDQVLREIGSLLRDNVRGPDIVFRYGGDEFLILLPETGEGSSVVIERLQDEMEEWNEENDLVDFPLSLAMGNAKFDPREDLTVEETIGEADRSMYEDKKRNN